MDVFCENNLSYSVLIFRLILEVKAAHEHLFLKKEVIDLIELKNPIIDRVTIIIEDVNDLKFELFKIYLSLCKVNFSKKWISCEINGYKHYFW